MLPFLRVSTTGLLFMLLGNLLFFVNVMGLTLRWKLALLKKFIAFVKSPLADNVRRCFAAGRQGGAGMKNGFLVFLASLIALGGSWCGFVLAPVLQLGGGKQTTILNSTDLYPVGRPGMANQGLQVYRANGCAACHTEQVQQSGMACDVVLTSAGKNPAAVTNLISSLKLNGLDKDARRCRGG